MMRTGLLILLGFLATPLVAQRRPLGLGPIAKGPVRVADLDLGKHWLGPKKTHADLLGNVVLFVYWGS